MKPSYLELYHQVLKEGERVVVRSLSTWEKRNADVSWIAGETVMRKKICRPLQWAEGLMLVAGMFDRDVIKRVAPNAQADLFTIQSAYGPRVRDHMAGVIQCLRNDPFSRRAIVFLSSNPEVGTADLPCTLSIQFVLRQLPDKDLEEYRCFDPVSRGGSHPGLVLMTTVNMRSSDLLYGLAYDCVQFGCLAQAVAYCLGVQAWTVGLHTASLHVYDNTRLQHITPLGGNGRKFFLRLREQDVPRSWSAVMEWARQYVYDFSYWKDDAPWGIRFSPYVSQGKTITDEDRRKLYD